MNEGTEVTGCRSYCQLLVQRMLKHTTGFQMLNFWVFMLQHSSKNSLNVPHLPFQHDLKIDEWLPFIMVKLSIFCNSLHILQKLSFSLISLHCSKNNGPHFKMISHPSNDTISQKPPQLIEGPRLDSTHIIVNWNQILLMVTKIYQVMWVHWNLNTVKPRFTAPRFTVNPDLPHLKTFPQYSETFLPPQSLNT